MLREEVMREWKEVKKTINNNCSFGSSYQYRLGSILQKLEHFSLKPKVDWEELELAVNSFCSKKEARIRNAEKAFSYCGLCPHCRENEPQVEEVD